MLAQELRFALSFFGLFYIIDRLKLFQTQSEGTINISRNSKDDLIFQSAKNIVKTH